jgi:hypothetical protein
MTRLLLAACFAAVVTPGPTSLPGGADARRAASVGAAADAPPTGAAPMIAGRAAAADTVRRLRNQARSAEAAFERLARRRAPVTWGGGYGTSCDEIIGRFCLRYDSTGTSSRPTDEEVGAVIDARRAAIEAQRRYFSIAPHERDAAGPLVRLLLVDDRPSEAVSAALTFAALSPDTLWGELLQGLAHQAAGNADAAQQHYARAVLRMPDDMRRQWTDPHWLLDPREQRAVRRLPPGERHEYERRFWLLADPLWLTAPNERWIEHMTRRVQARLHSEVPRVSGMNPWGRDLDEITIRWGLPTTRSQVLGNRPGAESSFIEYYDTAQRAFAPERLLTAGVPEPPLPGDPAAIYAARARSVIALPNISRVVDLPHQVTRFLAGSDVVVRVDGLVPSPPDSLARQPVQLGLFVYDSALTRRSRSVRAELWTPDSLHVALWTRAPAGQLIYSIEALDTAADFAARARYALSAFVPESGPVVSDLLIGAAFEEGELPDRRDHPGLRPLPVLEVARGSVIGVYAEVYRLADAGPDALRVEFSLEPADSPGLLSQFARWLGRAAGLVQPQADPRVAWQAGSEDAVHPLALNLPLDPGRRGRHVLILRVTDVATGVTTESRRVLLVRDR